MGIISTGPVMSTQVFLELQDDFLAFQAFKNLFRGFGQDLNFENSVFFGHELF